MDPVNVDLDDADIYGLERLEQIILHNIENEGKIVKISKSFTTVYGIFKSLQKYHTGITHNGKSYDADFFRKGK